MKKKSKTTQKPAPANKKPAAKKTTAPKALDPLQKVREARARSASTQGSTSGGAIPQGGQPPRVVPLKPRPEPETRVTKTVTTMTEVIKPAAPKAPTPAATPAPTPVPAAAPVVPPLPPASPTPAELQAKDDEAKALAEAEQAEQANQKRLAAEKEAAEENKRLQARVAQQIQETKQAEEATKKLTEESQKESKTSAKPSTKWFKTQLEKTRRATSNVRWFPILKWVLIALLACLLIFLGANWWIDRRQAKEFAESVKDPVTLPEVRPEVTKNSDVMKKDSMWSGITEWFRNRSSRSTPTSPVTSPAAVALVETKSNNAKVSTPIAAVVTSKPRPSLEGLQRLHNTGTFIVGDGNTVYPGCCPSVLAVTNTPPPALPKAWWDGLVPDYREDILQSCPSPNEVSSQNTKQKLLLPGEGGTVYLIPAGGWRIVPHLVNSIDRSRIKCVVDIGEINKPQWVDPEATSETARSFWIKNTGTEPIPLWFQLTAPK